MRIIPINSQISYNQKRYTQPNFQAVIEKYVKEARRQMQVVKCVNGRLLEEILDNVLLFKKISKQDAIDTLLKIKDVSSNIKLMAEDYINVLRKS